MYVCGFVVVWMDIHVCFVVYAYNKTNQELPVGRHTGVFLFGIHNLCL